MSHPYHTKTFKKCKYCDQEAKRNIYMGRNKGHYITCGSMKCLTEQHRSQAVKDSKAGRKEKVCDHCTKTYMATSARQRWCEECTGGTSEGRARFRRYNITDSEYKAVLVRQDGKCPICLIKSPRLVVDHDHTNGEVRGIICDKCNHLLHWIDEGMIIERAIAYKHNKLKNAL